MGPIVAERWPMLTLVCVSGIIGMSIGAFAAACSDVFPSYRRTLSVGGGSVLVGGISLLGLALPLL